MVATAFSKYQAGRFTARTSLGLQSITGLGFRPSFVLFLASDQTSVGVITGGSSDMCIGGMNDTDEFYYAQAYLDGVGSWGYSHSRHSDEKVIGILSSGPSPSILAEAAFSAMLDDGFQINWTSTDGSPREIDYLAFSDDIDAKITTFQTPATTGEHFIETGNYPDVMMVFGSFNSVPPPITNNWGGINIGTGVSKEGTKPNAGVHVLHSPGHAEERAPSRNYYSNHLIDVTDTYGLDRAAYYYRQPNGLGLNWLAVDPVPRYYTLVTMQTDYGYPFKGEIAYPAEPSAVIQYPLPQPARAAFWFGVNRTYDPSERDRISLSCGFLDKEIFQGSRWVGFNGGNAARNLSNYVLEVPKITDGEIQVRANITENIGAYVEVAWDPTKKSDIDPSQIIILGYNLPIYSSIESESEVTGVLSGVLKKPVYRKNKGRIFIPSGFGSKGRIIK